ncbi:allatostatin-A receptor-like [Tubulanus polymorphus]|uniref:allatostatin-A receptor-like n=1 Tax=Tubulanus polymorphus TaxID=672921 RepID=UPI003DA5674A
MNSSNETTAPRYFLPWYTSVMFDSPRLCSPMLRYAQVIILPIITVTGLFGNVASFIIMTSEKFRVCSYASYLAALAVFDTLLMFAYTAPVLNYAFYPRIVVELSTDFACEFYEYFFQVTDIISSGLIVLLTAERFAIVVWPFSARTIATPSVSRTLVILLTVTWFASFTYIFAAVEYSPDRGGCVFVSEYWSDFYFRISPTFTSYLPVTVVVIFNVVLIAMLRRSEQFGGAGGKKANSTRKATFLVITVSIMFAAFIIPTDMFVLISTFVVIPDQLLSDISVIMADFYATNSVINFYIYLLSGDEVKNYVKKNWLPRWNK